ncbi:uncharacterized protein ARMOST_20855 [Armillaria ostoyae]|uniref:Uncharacterized protein n=1 Tax=Armillaria ostoyae TaxID=47428 RepID=A0A284S8K8_ARMOS|nr:uncharacterized protein ARMOST_20855 [Armillaria ostoyae]
MYPEPPRPPHMRTTGTYGLSTNSFPCPPMTRMTYHPWNGLWYQSDPIPSWLSPLHPHERIFIQSPAGHFLSDESSSLEDDFPYRITIHTNDEEPDPLPECDSPSPDLPPPR